GRMIAINDPRIAEFVRLWHESKREDFERTYTNLDYDGPTYQHHAKDRSKYIAFDQGDGGVYLLDKESEMLYRIKAYGVPNKKKPQGTLDECLVKLQRMN